MKMGMYLSLPFLLLASVAFAEIRTDYDHLARFGQYHTFDWKAAGQIPGLGNNSLLRSRVENAVKDQLVKEGMREVGSNPDVYLSYHFRVRDIAYPGWDGWHRWGWRDPTVYGRDAYIYSEGVLVIDMTDTKTGQLVWRAYCTDTGSNPLDVQSAKKIDKLVAGAFKHFPPAGSRES